MKLQFEFGHDSKVSASSAQRPEQIRIFLRISTHAGSIRSHETKSLDVVAGQAESPGEPSCPSTKNESRSTGMRDHARGKDQSGYLRRGIDRSQEAPPRNTGKAGIGINRYF